MIVLSGFCCVPETVQRSLQCPAHIVQTIDVLEKPLDMG